MKLSLSYYLIIFVLKIKGLKKKFSKDPIDFKSLRNDDVKTPKDSFFKQKNIIKFKIDQSDITGIVNHNSRSLILYIPGGAFVSGPCLHHWDFIKNIYKETQFNIWLCDYPKAPEYNIQDILTNIVDAYKHALKTYSANEIIIMGDSAGATIALSMQFLLDKSNIEKPKKIIAISPVVDSTLTNLKIDELDKTDPILSKKGVLSAKKMCTQSFGLNSELISPKNLSLHIFPPTVLFLSENDILFPDGLEFSEKLISYNSEHKVIIGKSMPHIWPLLPIMKEAKFAFKQIVASL